MDESAEHKTERATAFHELQKGWLEKSFKQLNNPRAQETIRRSAEYKMSEEDMQVLLATSERNRRKRELEAKWAEVYRNKALNGEKGVPIHEPTTPSILSHDICGVQNMDPPKGPIFETPKHKPKIARHWHAPIKKVWKVKSPRTHEPLSLTLVDLKKSPSLLDIMRMEE